MATTFADLKRFLDEIELKYDAQPPEWILNVTAQMGLQQLSYSKYASGVERVHKIGRATVS